MKIKLLALLLTVILCLPFLGLPYEAIPHQNQPVKEVITQQSQKPSQKPTLSLPPEPRPKPTAVICLDAGHGFADPGCESEYMIGHEHEVTMDITLRLKAKLEEMGAKVILTHDGESYPNEWDIQGYADSLGIAYDKDMIYENDVFAAYERGIYIAAMQRVLDVDLAVSLHINSASDYPESSRYELYYCEENPYREILYALCEGIAAQADNETRILPTEYDDSYFVTKFTKRAAMLIEMGYATNARDAANLNDPDWREEFTGLLAEQIIKQFGTT